MSSTRTRLAALAVAAGVAAVGIGAGTASAAAPAAAPAPQLVTKSATGYTPAVGGLRIRSGPSTGYAAYGLLYRGDRFVLIGSANRGHGTWYHIRLTRHSASGLRSGHTGWVSAAYVRHA